jgi:hypothetical protein
MPTTVPARFAPGDLLLAQRAQRASMALGEVAGPQRRSREDRRIGAAPLASRGTPAARSEHRSGAYSRAQNGADLTPAGRSLCSMSGQRGRQRRPAHDTLIGLLGRPNRSPPEPPIRSARLSCLRSLSAHQGVCTSRDRVQLSFHSNVPVSSQPGQQRPFCPKLRSSMGQIRGPIFSFLVGA